jgi:hypothetical protein
MFGRKPQISPLELRKQLLIAESELNRAQMAEDLASLATGVRAFTEQAKSLASMAASSAALVTGLASCWRGKPSIGEAKPSWLQAALKTAVLIFTLWQAFRTKDRAKQNQ